MEIAIPVRRNAEIQNITYEKCFITVQVIRISYVTPPWSHIPSRRHYQER